MSIQDSFQAMRGVGAVIMRRILRPVLLVVGLMLFVLYGLLLYLASAVSLWWLGILAVLVPLTVIVGFIGGGLWYITGRVAPRSLTRAESKQIAGFCDKVLGIAERAKMPYPVLVVLIGKDVIRGRESKFLREIIGDSKSLTKEFGEIRDLFI